MIMRSWNQRTELLLGAGAVAKFAKSHVLVAGMGGVGSFAAEFLVRAGVGKITIVDSDKVEASNRNRQIPALKSNEGRYKTEVMAERLKDINPDLQINPLCEYIKDKKTGEILSSAKFDYVVDAIDSLSPKVFLIAEALGKGYRVVSSMGSGGRVDIREVRVGDIEESYNCPLARQVRKRLHRLGIRGGFKVVYSPESAVSEPLVVRGRTVRGTISYMPAVFGAYCAYQALDDLACFTR